MILVQIGLGCLDDLVAEGCRRCHGPYGAGSAFLALGASLTFRLFCGARIRDFVLPDAINRGLIERIA